MGMESPAKLSLENALWVSEESCNAWKTAHEQTCKQVAELSAKAHCLQAELTAEKNNVASLKREVERLTSLIHLIPYYPNVATPQTEEAFDGHDTRKLTAPSSKDGNQEKGMHLNGYLNAVTVNMLIGDNQTIRRDL